MGTKLQRIHEDMRRDFETSAIKGGKKRDVEVEKYIDDLRQQLNSERKERDKLSRTVL